MDGARHQLLAGTGRPHDQQTGVGGRDPVDGLVQRAHHLAGADHAVTAGQRVRRPAAQVLLDLRDAVGMAQRVTEPQRLDRLHLIVIQPLDDQLSDQRRLGLLPGHGRDPAQPRQRLDGTCPGSQRSGAPSAGNNASPT